MKKSFKLLSAALFALAAFMPVQAQTMVTVADGTAVGEYAPVYGYNFESEVQHNQMQYPAAELAEMANGAEINAMKFYTSTPDEVNALGGVVKVSLANIDDVTPWPLNGYGYVTGDLLDVAVTTVAATVTPAAEDGVWTITFDAPFTYTGKALLIDVETVERGDWKDTGFYGKEMGDIYVMSTYGYAGSKKGQTILPKVTFVCGGGEPQPTYELGDVDHSGGVDIEDVTILINKVLGNSPATYFPEQANCNGDAEGMVDIEDVTILINRVLTGAW
jgi:hypothetical protein